MLWEQGVVSGQSRSFIMMMGSALAFLTLGTLFKNQKADSHT
jgi:hypothetical protein